VPTATQFWSTAQAVPQLPQLRRSTLKFVHVPEQSSNPVSQAIVHCPSWHFGRSAGQGRPQFEQFKGVPRQAFAQCTQSWRQATRFKQ